MRLDNDIINPRRACAARVTVVVLCVCVSVCLCVCVTFSILLIEKVTFTIYNVTHVVLAYILALHITWLDQLLRYTALN